jgi:hypothetical protein
MRKPLFFIALFVVMSLALSGCFAEKGPAFSEVNKSKSGVLLEETMPEDTWFALQFSTLNDEQRLNFRSIVSRFADNPDALRDEILKGVDANLGSIDLSYVKDIEPVLGENGFRFLLGMSEGQNGETVTHVAVTLDKVDEGRSLLSLLEKKGRFLKKQIGEQAIYFNATAAEAGEEVFNFSLYEDVMLIANDEQELLAMIDLARSEGSESLWTKSSYQDVVTELPGEALFSVYMDSELLNERREEAMAETGSVPVPNSAQGLVAYLRGQGLAFVATDKGLDFRGIAVGDRDKINEDDATLDQLKAKKVYLDGSMPSDRVALYLESYDFAATLERQLGAEGEATLASLGLDPSQINLDKIFGRGYAVAVHQNSGVVPGVTLMVDVSKGKSTAKALLDQLDEQVSGLMALVEFQGGTALAGALERNSVQVSGETFQVIRLNVGKVMQIYQQGGQFALPAQLGAEDIVLSYGITKDDRFVVSTYDGWLDDPRAMLTDDASYVSTLDQLDEFKEGIVYVQFSELLALAETFQSFRDALNADATKIYAESAELLAIESDMAEAEAVIAALEGVDVSELGDGPRVDLVEVPEVASVDWVQLLAPLKSFAFSSEAEKYQVRLGGVVVLNH